MGARPDGVELWQGGIVPYEINPDLGNIVSIREAIRTFEQQTNVRFVARYLQEDYVRFSKQTSGPPNSEEGRMGGRQFVNASLNDVGSLIHEICHTLGVMHEHQREDRDDFVIFHADRVTEYLGEYETRDTALATQTYDFQSIMHYHAGDPGNPVFESRTGFPTPANIGNSVTLTATDQTFLNMLYPAVPVVRRTDGEGGAGGVFQTAAVAIASQNNTAVVANAVVNESGNYQLVLWRVRDNGVILRMPDPPGATGGKASNVQIAAVGALFVSAMADADGELLLITHDSNFARLKDSAAQAGDVRDLHLVPLTTSRVLTACVSAAGRLFNIVWDIQPDGTITRLFDSGTNGPEARTVAATLFRADPTSQLVGALVADGAGDLVLSTWRVDATAVSFLADSGNQMGSADIASVVSTPTGHLVVACRDGSGDLLLIPFSVPTDGTSVQRFSIGEAHAGAIQGLAVVLRPDGFMTVVVNGAGNLLLIKWRINADGVISRLGDSGDQAGEATAVSAVALPFANQATICTTVRDGSGQLLPITWDDAGGPGELSLVSSTPATGLLDLWAYHATVR